MTTTAAGLLRHILERPDDTDARLIMSDWLDDHDESERAEFIRCQVRIAQIRAEVESDDLCDEPTCSSCAELRPLLAREAALMKSANLMKWGPDGVLWDAGMKLPVLTLLPESPDVGHADNYFGTLFRRGFVEKVVCPISVWLAHGKDVCLCQPVTRAVLADKEPVESVSGWWWSSPRAVGGHPQSVLPEPLFSLLPGVRPGYSVLSPSYPSRDDALTALSRACVNHARRLADLPPLP